MKKIRFVALIFALLSVLSFSTIPANVSADQSGLRIPEQVTGDLAYQHVFHLAEVIGARPTGTLQDIETADYVIEQFSKMGYEVEIQPFSFTRYGSEYESENIIATKKGKFDQTVIIGAHYDSVSERSCEDIGEIFSGAGDNASGVGVMLEAAEILSEYKTLGTIKFIAFGAEEVGLRESRYYAG